MSTFAVRANATDNTRRIVEQTLCAFVHPYQDTWASYLPVTKAAYNNATHASTCTTPSHTPAPPLLSHMRLSPLHHPRLLPAVATKHPTLQQTTRPLSL